MGLRSVLRGVVLSSAAAASIGVFSQVGVGVASADPVGAPVCATPGVALSGHHGQLTVSGNAYVADGATLSVSGTLTIAPGACLDAFSLGTVHVGHNVLVERGATLALGCAPGANGPPPIPPCGFTTTNDTVRGSILASAPQTMYLTAVKVTHNVVSIGGGPGPSAVGVSFPVKDMTIGGSLVMAGWQGGWIGALRNSVAGNMLIAGNVGSRPDESGQPDSTEVDGNTVGGDLVCVNNTPAAQFGDAPPPHANTVGGRAYGECAGLTS